MRASSQPLLFDVSAGRGFGSSSQIYPRPDLGTSACRRDAVDGASGRDINATALGVWTRPGDVDYSCPRPERAETVYRLDALT